MQVTTWLTLEHAVEQKRPMRMGVGIRFPLSCGSGTGREIATGQVSSRTVTSEDGLGLRGRSLHVSLYHLLNAAFMFSGLFCECVEKLTCFMKEFDAGIFLGE